MYYIILQTLLCLFFSKPLLGISDLLPSDFSKHFPEIDEVKKAETVYLFFEMAPEAELFRLYFDYIDENLKRLRGQKKTKSFYRVKAFYKVGTVDQHLYHDESERQGVLVSNWFKVCAEERPLLLVFSIGQSRSRDQLYRLPFEVMETCTDNIIWYSPESESRWINYRTLTYEGAPSNKVRRHFLSFPFIDVWEQNPPEIQDISQLPNLPGRDVLASLFSKFGQDLESYDKRRALVFLHLMAIPTGFSPFLFMHAAAKFFPSLSYSALADIYNFSLLEEVGDQLKEFGGDIEKREKFSTRQLLLLNLQSSPLWDSGAVARAAKVFLEALYKDPAYIFDDDDDDFNIDNDPDFQPQRWVLEVFIREKSLKAIKEMIKEFPKSHDRRSNADFDQVRFIVNIWLASRLQLQESFPKLLAFADQVAMYFSPKDPPLPLPNQWQYELEHGLKICFPRQILYDSQFGEHYSDLLDK